MTHPAHQLSFSELYDGLQEAWEAGLVSVRDAPDGRRLYCYTRRTVYERLWTPITTVARGLIVDPVERRIVATPFSKFFNLGERTDPLPETGFETFEKLDGSLVVLHHHGGRWHAATKGSFDSDQARWAQEWIGTFSLAPLEPGVTYLCEAVGPQNKIVVPYDESELVLLAAYDDAGQELGWRELGDVADAVDWAMPDRYAHADLAHLVEIAGRLPGEREGFVLRFYDGTRLKIKGDEYRRLHALISRVTPLAVWEAMATGDSLEIIRQELPEEFWGDFDQIVGVLSARRDLLVARVEEEARLHAGLTDKELGLQLHDLPPDVRSFIFPYRRNDGDLTSCLSRVRRALYREIRPTANKLAGYTPSYAMNRVQEEML